MTYSKIYFFFILFLTIFGNVKAQQVIFFSVNSSVAVVNLDGTDQSITLKPTNHKDKSDYKAVQVGSHNVVVVNKEPSIVWFSYFRNGSLVNRVKEYGQKVASIVTLNPGDTLEINSVLDQESKEKKNSIIQSKLD